MVYVRWQFLSCSGLVACSGRDRTRDPLILTRTLPLRFCGINRRKIRSLKSNLYVSRDIFSKKKLYGKQNFPSVSYRSKVISTKRHRKWNYVKLCASFSLNLYFQSYKGSTNTQYNITMMLVHSNVPWWLGCESWSWCTLVVKADSISAGELVLISLFHIDCTLRVLKIFYSTSIVCTMFTQNIIKARWQVLISSRLIVTV
jgi:hypothetical protein